jgi:hypothetical protein
MDSNQLQQLSHTLHMFAKWWFDLGFNMGAYVDWAYDAMPWF